MLAIWFWNYFIITWKKVRLNKSEIFTITRVHGWTTLGLSSSCPVNSGRSVPFDADLSKDEKKVKSYQIQIEEINIDGMLEKDENEVLYGRAGYLSGGFNILY